MQFFLGCRDCCPPVSSCELGFISQSVANLDWQLGVMNGYRTVCSNPSSGPLAYNFFYLPTKTRLSPPDGSPGTLSGGSCFGPTAADYFVNDRTRSRHINPRGHRCYPEFAVAIGETGGTEEPGSFWVCDNTLISAASSSVGGRILGYRDPFVGGHSRNGTRWPEYAWDRKPDAPDKTLWEYIAACVGFEPLKITVLLTISWNLRVNLVIGHINEYGALWGTTETKTDVPVNWELGIGSAVYDRDESAARAMLSGNIGGREIWSLNHTQIIPGDAQRGSNGPPTPQWPGLQYGDSLTAEFDVGEELKATNLSRNVYWLGPRLSPAFGEPTGHLGDVEFGPPVYNPPITVQNYELGYWRVGLFEASFAIQSPPPGGALVGNFRVYPPPL